MEIQIDIRCSDIEGLLRHLETMKMQVMLYEMKTGLSRGDELPNGVCFTDEHSASGSSHTLTILKEL